MTLETEKADENRKGEGEPETHVEIDLIIWPSYASYFAFPSLCLGIKSDFVFCKEERAKFKLNRNTLQWLVRWFSLLPPRATLDKKIRCQTVTAEPEHSPLSLHSPPFSLLTSATQTTRLCCKQHTCWLHSPSGPAPSLAQLFMIQCRTVYNLGTQSWSCCNCSVYFTLAH